MEWGDLARQVIGLGAPMLGAALGGPLGGAAGQILAQALGASPPTPATVQPMLPDADPGRLAEAEARWSEMIRAEAEAQRAAIAETNATIRAEIASGDPMQRWWRPLYAGELTLECAALWSVVVHELWTGDVQTINALVGASALLVAYWGFRFGVLGVYVAGRTREKVCAATGQDAPGLIERMAKSVAQTKSIMKKR